jgi:hypothetical protein
VQNRFAILGFTLTNDGEKKAELIECSFGVEGCPIKELTVSPKILHPTKSIDNDKATVKVPRLNAGQWIRVSAVVTNPEKVLETIKVLVTGDDVVGTTKPRIVFFTPNALLTAVGSILWVTCILIVIYLDRRFRSTMKSVTRSTRGEIRRVEKLMTTSLEFLKESDDHLKRSKLLVERQLSTVEKFIKEPPSAGSPPDSSSPPDITHS